MLFSMQPNQFMPAIVQSVIPVILAGGKGTRLAPSCPGIPKVIVPVAGRPFIEYLLDHLMLHGFREVVLCVGYLKDQIIKTLGNSYCGMKLIYSMEDKPLGTGGALKKLLNNNTIRKKFLLVMNGDSFSDVALDDYISWHILNRCKFSLVLVEINDVSRYGKVCIDSKQKVVSFNEKSAGGRGLINCGIYLFDMNSIRQFLPDGASSLEYDVLPQLIIDGGIYGYKTKKGFIDIGTPESYRIAQSLMGKKK